MCFTGVICRSRNDSNTAPTLKPNSTWMRAHESWNTEHTAQFEDSLTGLRVFFAGSSVGFSLFHTTQLVSTSSRHLSLSKSVSQQSLQPMYDWKYRNYWIWSVSRISWIVYFLRCNISPSLTLCLNESPSKMEGLNLRGICYTAYAWALHIYVCVTHIQR
jgi:hypothetical protein